MTLVMASNFGQGVAIMTSDTREVFSGYWYDAITGTYTPDEDKTFVVSKDKNIKTKFITDYVLLGAAGISDLCRFFLKEMAETAEKEDDLEDCHKLLTKIIREARNNMDAPPYFSFLDEEHGATVILNGFTRDGRSGLVLFDAGPGTEPQLLVTPSESARWIMTVSQKYQHLGPDLVNHIMDGPSMINQALTVHAKIAFAENVLISPDCHYFVLFYHEDGHTSTFQGEFDTSAWFEFLKQLDAEQPE